MTKKARKKTTSKRKTGKRRRKGPGPKTPPAAKKTTTETSAAESLPRQRIQKLLANAGFGSRREIEAWMQAGRVMLNGRPASPGDQAGEGDHLSVDGRSVAVESALMPTRRVLIYHKPMGEMCTRHDPRGRPTIFSRLPGLERGRWVAVGRLDFNTSGLMVLTTDGQLAARLMHPSSQVMREYAVRVRGQASPEQLDRLIRGVTLEDGPARFESVTEGGGSGQNFWYHVILREGRYREVRRMFEAVDLSVSRLSRVRYGPLSLPPDLPRGQWRELGAGPVRALMDAAGLQPDTPLAEAPEKRPPRKKAGRSRKKSARTKNTSFSGRGSR